MKRFKLYISVIISTVILMACLLPALHAFSHDISFADDDTLVHFSDIDSGAHCDLCSFHLTTSDFPEFYSYTLYIPLKQEVYNISLEDKANRLPLQLFQLRAPPAVIG